MENFVYSTVNKIQTEELVNSDKKRSTLRKIMKFNENDEKSEILLDFFESLTSFCLSLDFTLEKISCSLGLLNYLIHTAISNSLPLSSSQDSFKLLLKKHSIQRPPFSIQVFSASDISSLESFVERTFFNHYLLYSYGFTPHKDIIVTTEKLQCGRFPQCIGLQESSEINPETIPDLKMYLPRLQSPKENKIDLGTKELEVKEEHDMDPVESYLYNEVKTMKNLIEEKVRKQDEEIFAKIELLKK